MGKDLLRGGNVDMTAYAEAANNGPAVAKSSTTAEPSVPTIPGVQTPSMQSTFTTQQQPRLNNQGGGQQQAPIFDGGQAFARNYNSAMNRLPEGLRGPITEALKNLPPGALGQMADGAVKAYQSGNPATDLLKVFIPDQSVVQAEQGMQTAAYAMTSGDSGGIPGDSSTQTMAYMYTPGQDGGGGGIPADGPGAPSTGNSSSGGGIPGDAPGGPAVGNSYGGGGIPGDYASQAAVGQSNSLGYTVTGNVNASQWNALSNIGLGDADLEAVAFIVLMQATSDMDKDLKMVMAEVKAMTAAKGKLRDLISMVNKDVAKNATQAKETEGDRAGQYKTDAEFGPGGLGATAGGYTQAEVPVPNPESPTGFDMVKTELMSTEPKNVDELKAVQTQLKDKLDSMNEVSEMTSLRLQMIMDRRAKMISTLTNVMKKISQTQDNVVQNLK